MWVVCLDNTATEKTRREHTMGEMIYYFNGEWVPQDEVMIHPYDRGFTMGFLAKVVPVELRQAQLLPPLLRQARSVWDMDVPPEGAKGCKDCAAVSGLLKGLGRSTN